MKIRSIFYLAILLPNIIFAQINPDILRLYYPFNGNANDESGNGNNGTVSGAVLTEDRFGNSNSAYYFDGNDDYIEVPDNESVSVPCCLSISVWYRYDGKGNRDFGRIVGKAWNSLAAPWISYGIYLDDNSQGNQKVIFEAHFSASQKSFSSWSITSLEVGQWYHLVGVYNPATSFIGIYVNGILESYLPTNNVSLANTTGSFRIGQDQQTGECAKGVIDDIRVMARPLTYTEVLALYYEVPPNKEASLDPSFGNGGVAITPGGLGYSAKIQSDGKIVIAGTDTSQNFTALRYNMDGTLDETFGNSGIVTTQVGNGNSQVYAAAIQSDGKIILTGNYETSTNNISTNNTGIAIVRYNTNGTLDNTFGNSGIILNDLSTSDDIANSIVIQPGDQKILIGGSTGNTTLIVRFNPNGTIDYTFGNNGVVTTQVGYQSMSSSMVLDNNGKIVLGGGSFNSTSDDILLIRYNINGDLDYTFGNNGIVLDETGAGSAWERSIVISGDGKIIVGTTTSISQPSGFQVVRYNNDGSRDLNFGSNGIVETTPSGIFNIARTIGIQQDNKILIGGTSALDSLGNAGFSLMRLEYDGAIDNSFGNDGSVISPLGLFSEGQDLVIQQDNKILMTGYSISGFTTIRYIVPSLLSIEGTFDSGLPDKLVLEQNYPNPFNPSTTIRYSIPNPGKVSIRIFDIAGQIVKEINLEHFEAGNYEIIWDGKNNFGDKVSSAVYFYQVSTGGFVESKKMILLK